MVSTQKKKRKIYRERITHNIQTISGDLEISKLVNGGE